LKNGEYVLLTNQDSVIGIVTGFENQTLNHGLFHWLGVKAFKDGDLSLSQLANLLGLNRLNTIEILGHLNIPIADYDLSEDLKTLNILLDERNC